MFFSEDAGVFPVSVFPMHWQRWQEGWDFSGLGSAGEKISLATAPQIFREKATSLFSLSGIVRDRHFLDHVIAKAETQKRCACTLCIAAC